MVVTRCVRDCLLLLMVSLEQAALTLAVAENVMPLLDAGHALPHLDSMHFLDRVKDAHDRVESSEHFGKVVLEVGGEDA